MIRLKSTKVLRLTFTAPSAQFRIIHSRNPRRTYPLPPYSTVIGILANIIGCQEGIQQLLQQQFALGILCSHDYKSREYTWLRNLRASAHKTRFNHKEIRKWQGMIDHPGGQSPIVVEVLNDVELIVYIYHPEKDILNTLKKNVFQPDNWLSHIHLGRSEDWATCEEAAEIDLVESSKPYDFSGAEGYYQWMPDPNYLYFTKDEINSNYEKLYRRMQGGVSLVTSVYRLVEVSGKNNKDQPTIVRNFSHIPARIANSAVPFLEDLSLPYLLCDNELHVPVYLSRINSNLGKE